jgi:hypothetical protein
LSANDATEKGSNTYADRFELGSRRMSPSRHRQRGVGPFGPPRRSDLDEYLIRDRDGKFPTLSGAPPDLRG